MYLLENSIFPIAFPRNFFVKLKNKNKGIENYEQSHQSTFGICVKKYDCLQTNVG